MSHDKHSKRATFQDVGESQDKLREMIDGYIKNNSILNGAQREDFIHLFREATLGFGANHRFFLKTRLKTHNIETVGHAAFWIAYRDATPIMMPNGESIEIREFWRQLRDDLFIIYDEAINLGIKISQEQIHFGPSDAGKV